MCTVLVGGVAVWSIKTDRVTLVTGMAQRKEVCTYQLLLVLTVNSFACVNNQLFVCFFFFFFFCVCMCVFMFVCV